MYLFEYILFNTTLKIVNNCKTQLSIKYYSENIKIDNNNCFLIKN